MYNKRGCNLPDPAVWPMPKSVMTVLVGHVSCATVTHPSIPTQRGWMLNSILSCVGLRKKLLTKVYAYVMHAQNKLEVATPPPLNHTGLNSVGQITTGVVWKIVKMVPLRKHTLLHVIKLRPYYTYQLFRLPLRTIQHQFLCVSNTTISGSVNCTSQVPVSHVAINSKRVNGIAQNQHLSTRIWQ